ncbi:unnamed protein product [Staurois parvus]|uniref:Uncharacterized protein n=1 Tax=Staurois parvus TaxID=386267 RepID=A0ABN9HJM0_9NEOB|nr:unnamed protein product [Staurois parvus]
MCHFQVSSPLLVAVPFCHRGAGRLRGLPLLLPGLNLPWAPVPPPHAAARSTVSNGP